ncbi:hypothetical protein L3Y34_001950 [Caenorhabditis briggsae]|uniref:RING-type domain-containing protein n=1 Tax=Caenorhabditis briggsae TaxID=6238 RepID=A0AAE9DDL8_CAEBR|nr:hypothetical protein L3Y34_001950 [Caenorhabditis briggsae]
METTGSNGQNVRNLLDVIERHSGCSICMATLYNAVSCSPCLHTFCAGCIVQWTDQNASKCPMCRIAVLDISPNCMMRELVDSCLLVNPALERTEEDKIALDKFELGYIVKWLGTNDKKLLYIESIAILRSTPERGDQKYQNMMSRALELFKRILAFEAKTVSTAIVQRVLDKLINNLRKEAFHESLHFKYHRLECAYIYMVRQSYPELRHDEHSCLATHCFDLLTMQGVERGLDESYEETVNINLNMPNRIDKALKEMCPPRVSMPKPKSNPKSMVTFDVNAPEMNPTAPLGETTIAFFESNTNVVPPPTQRPSNVTIRRTSNVTIRRYQANQDALDDMTQIFDRNLTFTLPPRSMAPLRRSARLAARNEVQNRYSAYIEARRSYLDHSESEEDLEVRTILRRPQTYFRRSISTSSEDQPQPTPAMVLVPTVTIQEAPKEVEIVVAEQPELIPSGSIIVQEVEILTPNEDEVKPDDPEQKSQDECAMCQKVGNYVRSSYEAGKARFQQLVNRLLDPSLHVTIRSEISNAAPTLLLALALFFVGITTISFVKVMSHGVHNEPSFFCRYFSGPFSPLFDALCKPEPFLLSEELPKVMCEVVDEIFSTLSEFFRTIGRGFSVFATLFTAIWHGLSENVFYGFHELGENLGENIGHLIHFVVQFFHQIIHLFLSSIATVAGAIAGVFTSLHDYLEPTRAEDVW